MTREHEHLFTTREIQHVPKPWGYELIFAKTDRYVGKILHVNRGESLSLQFHEMKDETLYVVAGELRLTIEFEGEPRSIYPLPGTCTVCCRSPRMIVNSKP